jgi:small multidrug resistance pump
MKPLFGYLFLAVGIFAGIAANSFAKISEGFTKTLPIIYMYLLNGYNNVFNCKSNVRAYQ